MQLTANNIFQKTANIFFSALFISGLVVMTATCSEKETTQNQTEEPAPETFTLFEVGRNSLMSKRMRQDLGDKLGRDAIEGRSLLNLEINYPGFLSSYFPDIDKLNQQLNFPPGERIDHNTIKLMYRYAQRRNIPFDYVELIFSDYTQKPVLIRIHFKKDESNIIKTLEAKYGPPTSIKWEKENGSSFYWTKDNDVLVVSMVPNQFGRPEYQIVIYFTENLNELITAEQAEKEAHEQKRAKSGKTAF